MNDGDAKPREPHIILGMMSGTSGDGIDAAAVRFDHSNIDLLAFESIAFTDPLREQLFSIRADSSASLHQLCRFTRDLTLLHATLARRVLERVPGVKLIAAHGQTLFHDPPMTMQVFDPALLAQEVGIDVASDFRRADCAAGGQGAPLVPIADHTLFSHATENRCMLNLGGIANVTFLKAGGRVDEMIAFDTGPANCVLDHLWRRHNRSGFDTGGALAITGTADRAIATHAAITADGLWDRLPPKSTDTPAMIRAFEQSKADHLSLPDLLATAALMAAMLLRRGLEQLPGMPIDRLFASGGGVLNRALVNAIEHETKLRLETTDALGIPTQAKEAVAFAILGHRLLLGLPGNVPRVTGASRGVLLGSITRAG